MKRIRLFGVSLALLSMSLLNLSAQDSDAVTQANNPLANIKALNLHDYYAPSMYGAEDASANQAFIRYAQPIGRVLIRASLPISTVNFASNYDSGLGDMQVFGAYLFSDPSSANQFGAGPLLVAPTGKSGVGGSGKWQAGLSAIAFLGKDPAIQYGALVTWQISFAGSENRKDVNALGFQPFLMWQLGKGVYLRNTATWTFNLEDGGVNVPMGLGIGKVVPAAGKVFNLFLEPQFSIYNHKMNASKYQFFAGINMQF